MRVSTMQMQTSLTNSMQRSSSDVNKTMLQLSTGKEILTASDDPFASAQLFSLDDQLSRLESWSNNIDLATRQLDTQETALNSMNNSLDRTRDLLLSAGNATLSAEDRSAIAKELTETVDALKSLANTKSSNGQYIFSGTAGNQEPISQNEETGEWGYNGSDNVRELPVSDSQSASLGSTANELFFSKGDDFFAQMDKVIATLNTDPLAEGELEDMIAESVTVIDNTSSAVNSALTGIGAEINMLENAEDTNIDLQTSNKAMQSSLEDLDYAEAITRLTMEQTALSATQKSFASSNQLSLFNYI